MDYRINAFISELRSISPAPAYVGEMIKELETEKERLGPDPTKEQIDEVLLPCLNTHLRAMRESILAAPEEDYTEEFDDLPFEEYARFASSDNDEPDDDEDFDVADDLFDEEDDDEDDGTSPLIRFIESAKNDPVFGKLYSDARKAAEKKLEELGPDHSFEEGEAALQECLKADIIATLEKLPSPFNSKPLPDTIRDFLKEADLEFSEREIPIGTDFTFGIYSDSDKLNVNYHVVAGKNSLTYTITADFPCIVDPKYALPTMLLCNKLSGKLPLGCSFYYEDDLPFGSNLSLNFSHHLDTRGKANPVLFHTYIDSMFQAIAQLNPIISRYAVGKLNRSERQELSQACKDIIDDMEEYL